MDARRLILVCDVGVMGAERLACMDARRLILVCDVGVMDAENGYDEFCSVQWTILTTLDF